MRIKNYLKRINVYTDIGVNLSSLKLIQKQHLLTVPFENLDIHIYKQIKTNFDFLYNKIVNEKRGGICYELNWLLYSLLKGIGFNTKVLGAKVIEENGSYFDHMLLIVSLNEKKYLIDVGYGDNFLEPLEFQLDIVQKDNKGIFKVVKIDEIHFELKKYCYEINDFRTEYIFKNEERQIDDFQNRIEYFTHSTESIFRKNLFCSLERENGRISLKHNKFLLTQKDIKTSKKISSQIEYINCLNKEFKIDLDLYEHKKIEEIWKHYCK